MQKTAQKRSVFNKLREFTNIPGAQLESFFKPELARVMADLKLADDNIRTLLTSQKIGDADIDVPAGRPIKDLLKSARSNFNRREYMAGVADLGQFHKRFYEVTKFIDKLELSVNKIHHAFLFQDLSPEQQENIKNLREHMSSLAEIQNSQYFIKEAGLFDFFHNIGTKRGRSLAMWEKKYPKVAKDLREQGNRLIDHAESLLSSTLSNLKTMATARATRQVDNYLAAANRINVEFKKFDMGDKGFRSYYENVVKPALVQQDKMEGTQSKSEAPAVKVPDSKEMGQQQVTPEDTSATIPSPAPKMDTMYYGGQRGEYSSPTIPAPPKIPFLPPSPGTVPTALDLPTSPQTPPVSVPPPAPPTSTKMTPEERALFERQHGFGPVDAHREFTESLISLSGEDPRILSKYIARYAKSIQTTDPDKALELFVIAKQLRG